MAAGMKSRLNFALESAKKKQVERTMSQISREFQSLRHSLNKKLREIGGEVPNEEGEPVEGQQ